MSYVGKRPGATVPPAAGMVKSDGSALQTATSGVDYLPVQNPTIGGNFTFAGTGNRILGDFSNATVANRVMFKNNGTGATVVGAVPIGVGNFSGFHAYSSEDPTNASYAQIAATNALTFFASGKEGTGTYLPMTFYTGGSERMRIDASGNVLVTSSGGLGYGTGAGGTVTQLTSRTTPVTINKPTGQITMFSAAGSTSWAAFTVNNSLVAATDTVNLSVNGGTNSYIVPAPIVAAGSFTVLFASTGGTATDAPVINFTVIKGAIT